MYDLIQKVIEEMTAAKKNTWRRSDGTFTVRAYKVLNRANDGICLRIDVFKTGIQRDGA